MSNKIAIIGGSGIDDMPAFKNANESFSSTTIFSEQGSGAVHHVTSKDGTIFIPRHGKHIRYGPALTQYLSNLVVAKQLGANTVIATSAVGSLHGDRIPVGNLVIPDDYIDESNRNDNVFGKGIIVHANPIPAFSEDLRKLIIETAKEHKYFQDKLTESGTYVTIPGDRFGTKAEGKRRAEYADVVGMTLCPEAAMATQLGLHYACIAIPVDVNLDANHEEKTIAVMKELSAPDKLPYFMTQLVENVKPFAENAGHIEQLKGNIIVNDLDKIKSPELNEIANELIKTYCE